MNKDTNDIYKILYDLYPDAHCELNHRNPFQLLVATILSAQTTDKQVNKVTEKLFEKYKIPEDFLKLTQEQLEQEIKKIGLYRSKAKNILQMCRTLIIEHDGQVPDNREDLMKLAGVGRKTANVVLSNAFNVPAFAVDTHVFRVSNRIGLVEEDDVLKTELALEKTIPKEHWIQMHHLLIFHGRRTCSARNPKCHLCPLIEHCKYYHG
ncbi:MAG: endonuclease III [Clostridia bacterium]